MVFQNEASFNTQNSNALEAADLGFDFLVSNTLSFKFDSLYIHTYVYGQWVTFQGTQVRAPHVQGKKMRAAEEFFFFFNK